MWQLFKENVISTKLGLVVILALIFIYVLPVAIPSDYKFWKKKEEEKQKIELTNGDIEDTIYEVENLVDENLILIKEYKQRIKKLEDEVSKKVPSITKLPPSSRDTLWTKVEKYILDSRQDENRKR